MQSKLRNSLASTKGFTLVELLIVVAIIGVLASQGVPAYKRMIQKSRKGEAQMLLGNIATAESGFFSEYGQYSNHIARIGAMAEGTNFVYAAGFPASAACDSIATGAVLPLAAGGANPVPNLPLNFAAGVPGPAALGGGLMFSMIGKVTNNVPANTNRNANCATAARAGLGTAAGLAVNVYAPTALQPAAFVAAATGNIVEPTGAQGRTCPLGVAANCDQWYIDQNRTLRNVNDGVRN